MWTITLNDIVALYAGLLDWLVSGIAATFLIMILITKLASGKQFWEKSTNIDDHQPSG